MVVTLSRDGYAKRTSLSTFRQQHRGGKGVVGMRKTADDDVIRHTLVADTKDTILFFTDNGRVYSKKCHRIPPQESRNTRGTRIQNVIEALQEGENVTSMVALSDLLQEGYLVMATQQGGIKRVPLERFARIRSSGIIAMDLKEGDHLISARKAADGDQVMVVTRQGKSVRFSIDELQVRSRTAGTVRAIRLREDDYVLAMDIVDPDGKLLLISENGYGKVTTLDGDSSNNSFRSQKRGGYGLTAYPADERTGPLAAALIVKGTEELVIATAKAQVQRTSAGQVREKGRYAKRGVTVMNVDEGDRVTSMAILTPPDAPEEKPPTQRTSRRAAGKAAADAQSQPRPARRPRPPHGQAASDIEDAAAGAEQLGMPLEDLGLEDDDAEDADIDDIVDADEGEEDGD